MYGQNSGAGRGSNRRSFQYQPGSGDYDEDITPRGMGDEQHTNNDQVDINKQPNPQTSQEPQHSGAYVVFPPNQARRDRLLQISSKEQEDYERWKEAQRPGPVNLTPMKLGGRTTESEVRQQQQQMQYQSKNQKKLQRDEYKRKLKEEEEAKIQEMKDIQRQKAEKQEERKRQQDMERRKRWHENMHTTNNQFLDRLSQPEINLQSHNSCERTPSAWVDEQEQNEDWILQQVLKESMEMHKAEEEERLRKMKEAQRTQSRSHAIKQDLDEGTRAILKKEKSWKDVKQGKDKDISNIQQGMEKLSFTEITYHKPTQKSYKQEQKDEEERRLKQMKEEQRRKSELLQQQAEERRPSQHEEQRRLKFHMWSFPDTTNYSCFGST
ncbi:epithelial-stromal interaction protein 1 isoform X2 [Mixophyes fleayi]|uniref:epithelial-stromal interaction protein 1 isoform X2 n=1 Tax=Mixophyes fleayi TaxID=3061075 RepID=UPI003F4E3640